MPQHGQSRHGLIGTLGALHEVGKVADVLWG